MNTLTHMLVTIHLQDADNIIYFFLLWYCHIFSLLRIDTHITLNSVGFAFVVFCQTHVSNLFPLHGKILYLLFESHLKREGCALFNF